MSAFDLERFVAAQDPVIHQVLAELADGCKRTHWMWFVFPQYAGLGASLAARHYAVRSMAEARAFLAHPVLGPRLADCTTAVMTCGVTDAHAIFGSPDDLKFRSCMTLFALASGDTSTFREAIERFFAGEEDPRTRDLLATRT